MLGGLFRQCFVCKVTNVDSSLASESNPYLDMEFESTCTSLYTIMVLFQRVKTRGHGQMDNRDLRLLL